MTEWNAGDYHQQSSLQQAMAKEQLDSLVLKGDERVLDVGCGDGKITAQIAAKVPNGSVLGVDPSRQMVSFASEHFGPPAHPNLRFEVADVRTMHYRNEFNLVVSFNALHWVREQEAALRSIRDALWPGGRAVLRFVPEGPRRSLEDVIQDACQSPRWAERYPDFRAPYLHLTADEYKSLAERAGFRVKRIEVVEREWDFKTREGFAGFARATFVEWTKVLPETDREAFIADVLDQYRAEVSEGPHDANVFKFYQMEVELEAEEG